MITYLRSLHISIPHTLHMQHTECDWRASTCGRRCDVGNSIVAVGNSIVAVGNSIVAVGNSISARVTEQRSAARVRVRVRACA